MIDTGEVARAWSLTPKHARKRIVKSAAVSAVLVGVGGAGLPHLVSMGGIHKLEDLTALFWVCLNGALFGLFVHFKQPGYRMPPIRSTRRTGE